MLFAYIQIQGKFCFVLFCFPSANFLKPVLSINVHYTLISDDKVSSFITFIDF